MVPKKRIKELIKLWAPKIIKHLAIEHCTIKWHVLHSKSKYLKDLQAKSHNCVAECLYTDDKSRVYDIIIYYDLQKGIKYSIGSIVHELLHIKMRKWQRLVPKKKEARAAIIEEELVQCLEKIFLDLI